MRRLVEQLLGSFLRRHLVALPPTIQSPIRNTGILILLLVTTASMVHAQVSGGLPPLPQPSTPKARTLKSEPISSNDINRQINQTSPEYTATKEKIEILGQQVSFTNPSGYCTLGSSQRERDLMAMSQRAVGPSARLVHAAIRCSELEAFRAGRRETLDHWLQIQLIGPKGDFKRLEMGREAFLVGLAKNSSPRLDAAEISRRLQAALENPDLSFSEMQVTPLGRDGNAVYFSIRMNLKVGESSRPMTGLSGFTLLNSLPLTVNVYEATGQAKSREQLQRTLQQLLMSLFTEN